jgi:S1-C subfamily serine protease
VRGVGAGEKLQLRIYRKEKELSFTFDTLAYPQERGPKLAWRRMGVKVTALDSAARQRFGLSARQGVVISAVRKESYMDQIGVLPGDVIRHIEDLSIENTETFVTAMIKHRYKPSLIVLLQRQDSLYHLTVRMSP